MNNESIDSAPRLFPATCTLRLLPFLAPNDVPLIKENQLSFVAAAGSLAFHLLQLTDLTASLVLQDDSHQELS